MRDYSFVTPKRSQMSARWKDTCIVVVKPFSNKQMEQNDEQCRKS